MAVTMEDVRAALDPEEPNYQEAAKLGPDTLPHLEVLVRATEVMLASKAAYLASLVEGEKSAEIVTIAAQSDDPTVRIAAAAAAGNLTASEASTVLVDLVDDADVGVRKVARASVPDTPGGDLAQKLEQLGDGPELTAEPTVDVGMVPSGTGLMPGEAGTGGSSGIVSSTMPGEGLGAMPGEQQTMPGGG
jgi:hypothetical protein